jgi:hypothetical protein
MRRDGQQRGGHPRPSPTWVPSAVVSVITEMPNLDLFMVVSILPTACFGQFVKVSGDSKSGLSSFKYLLTREQPAGGSRLLGLAPPWRLGTPS